MEDSQQENKENRNWLPKCVRGQLNQWSRCRENFFTDAYSSRNFSCTLKYLQILHLPNLHSFLGPVFRVVNDYRITQINYRPISRTAYITVLFEPLLIFFTSTFTSMIMSILIIWDQSQRLLPCKINRGTSWRTIQKFNDRNSTKPLPIYQIMTKRERRPKFRISLGKYIAHSSVTIGNCIVNNSTHLILIMHIVAARRPAPSVLPLRRGTPDAFSRRHITIGKACTNKRDANESFNHPTWTIRRAQHTRSWTKSSHECVILAMHPAFLQRENARKLNVKR